MGSMGGQRAWTRTGAPLLLALVVGCATGGEPDFTSNAYDGPSPADDGATSMLVTTGGDEETGDEDPTFPPPTADGPGLPDLGSCETDLDCVLPAGTCLEQYGHCEGGMCEHGAADPGVPCDDADPCTDGDACDGEGFCIGVTIECTAPNAQGGSCVGGMCTGLECSAGWDDCNGDMNDGCETPLGTDSDCGSCSDACAGAAHASGSCMGGSCQYQCQSPWENCDGNWSNGCEIPTGVAHACNASGINQTSGCWTAYCGNSADPNATNFGTFYCMDCATCRSPGAGECQWCDHASGNFFPADACACGSYEDLTCS